MSDNGKSTEETIYRLKITLDGSQPPVWRQVEVPADVTLDVLHVIVQFAMGWEDYHLHEFIVGEDHYGEPDPEYEMFGQSMKDEVDVTLKEVAPKEGSKVTYIYDFGDGWKHTILVEKILPADPSVEYPICTGGQYACPPEDCGGIGGYAALLEALADPEHPEHDELSEWVGEELDPEAFDLDEINEALEVVDEYVDEMLLLDEDIPDLADKDIGEIYDTVIDQLGDVLEELKELPDGYEFRFPNDPVAYYVVTSIIPFALILRRPLRYVLEIAPVEEGPIVLRILGPKDLIDPLLDEWHVSPKK
jgi:hypothetical protein